MRRSLKLTSHRDVWVHFSFPHFLQPLDAQIEVDCSHEVSRLLLGCDQNGLTDSTFIKIQNGLLYYSQPCHCPPSIECLGVDCKVGSTNPNQGIMPESHNIWVKYTDGDVDNPIQSWIPSIPVWYSSWTPPNQIFQFHELLPTGNLLSSFYKRCKKTQQWIICS